MAEAEELRGMGCFSLASGVSRDPLHLCVNGGSFPGNFDRRIQTKERNGGGREAAADGGEEGGIELSLGLSLNGKFGVDPNRAQKLKRCSSISSFALNGGARAFSPYAPPLSRTCSLPAEAAETEEWRRRKEAQSQKRMEAKRKRMEKLKNVRVVREKLDKEDPPHSEENGNGLIPVLSNGNALPSSQGSSVSQGSGSSGISDFDSQPLQVCGKNVEARSPSSVHSRELEQRPAATLVEPAVNNSGNSGKDSKEVVVRNALFNMPCVTTRGDGPEGKKIEGFLYRYRKGEEVRIVCVCHGNFLSPAEFVKHAGGGDVAHPLKHIIVSPSCLF
ncbi:PREDICTED: ninja-family protein AFP3-like [Ipomoea nil]|uniref:ninja-family protein AFP3-like n=1 Tax=Ipomoea nil TaxID=35883 RepID=UPI0009008695|nr:PREDICTED: ninja-family protein AFP3-like [Ipomoea nil]